MFALEIKVQGFSSKDSSGRKIYTKARNFKWDVEYGSLTLELLLSSLRTELNLCTNQTPTVWFFDKSLNEDVRLVDEIQMVDLCDMYKEEMSCDVIVGVFDRATCEEAEFDALEPICVIPPDDETHVEPEREPEAEADAAASMANENDPTSDADDIEPDREPDIFDNPEEYVGVNDEGMYGSVPPAPQFAQPSDNANTNTNDEENAEFFNVEAEVDDDDPLEVNVVHDPENPKIVKGELFPDINSFRKAIRHYAVKTGFAFAAGVKTDKTRFIAKCAAETCPWRIHASTIWDKKTVQVPYLTFVFSLSYNS
jgi:hypothetical protein